VLYPEQSVASLIEAVQIFETYSPRITAQACRANAERFSQARFEQEMRQFVDLRLSAAREKRQPPVARPAPAAQVTQTVAPNELCARVVPIKSV
jgi:hypothetical protein